MQHQLVATQVNRERDEPQVAFEGERVAATAVETVRSVERLRRRIARSAESLVEPRGLREVGSMGRIEGLLVALLGLLGVDERGVPLGRVRLALRETSVGDSPSSKGLSCDDPIRHPWLPLRLDVAVPVRPDGCPPR